VQLAFEAHDGQKRRSGEPFIIHPVEVARILGELVSHSKLKKKKKKKILLEWYFSCNLQSKLTQIVLLGIGLGVCCCWITT
jgi:hypothetical protein